MKHCWEIDSRIRYNGEEMRKLCKVIATTKGRAGSWAVNFWHKEFPGSEVKVKKL